MNVAMKNMIVYPAIDLRHGRCVRLTQGSYDAETRYSDEPLAVARGFAAQGADWLHVVDLDGAKDPRARQLSLVKSLARDSGLRVQTGGGVRSAEQVAELLDAGCERVIVGSLAVKQPDEVKRWLARFGGERIVLALDVNLDPQGRALIAVAGWQEASSVTLEAVVREFLPAGLRHALCTDIGRDGLLQGPNLALYRELVRKFPELAVIASGGVASLEDVRALRELGLAGMITGKALYENRFTVAEALSCSRAA